MNNQIRTIARLAAIVGAITLLAYYVVNSQRQAAAQPQPTVAPGSKPMAAGPLDPSQRTMAPGSKAGAVTIPPPVRTFLPGSKSAPVGPITIKNNPLTVPAEQAPAQQTQP